MSTAARVPETRRELDAHDARAALKRVGWPSLLKAAFERFVTADGTSFTRAFGHAAVLTGIPALIMVVGFASVFELSTFRDVLEQTLRQLAPGPSSRLLSQAFKQGTSGGALAFVGGAALALYGGTLTFLQVERGSNRIYGIPTDRPLAKRVVTAFGLTLTSGLLLGMSFILLATGGALSDALEGALGWSGAMSTVFAIARWPIGLLLAFAGLTIVYKFGPSRNQPSVGWLQTGTIVATLLWFIFSGALAVYYSVNDQIMQTFGPLVGVIAVLSWAYATGLALFLGISFSAELEVRAKRRGRPRE